MVLGVGAEPRALTVVEAAEFAGVATSTVRRWVAAGVLAAHDRHGWTYVNAAEVAQLAAQRPPGRPRELPQDVRARIGAEHDAGRPLRRIAAGLNLDGVPTAHGGRRWWASTVRAVLAAVPREACRSGVGTDRVNPMDGMDQERV
jgi:excisionase family DNA binding protein